MSIDLLSDDDAWHRVAASLHMKLPDPITHYLPQIYAQALRRASVILAPCGRNELERSVTRSFAGLLPKDDELRGYIADVLEELLVYGDVLEMRSATSDPWREKQLVLRPAPPAFVQKKNGTFILIGVAGDDITPVIGEMSRQIQYHGVLRLLASNIPNLKANLLDLGVLELPEKAWLRLPPVVSWIAYLAQWVDKLVQSPTTENVDGLQIIDTRKSVKFYPGRFVVPSAVHSGMYVGRRTQKYGAPLWCIVRLEAGTSRALLDLVSPGDRERPCDLAWRIQMAIDAQANTPQLMRERGDERVLDFFSPIPSWAERKLATIGGKVAPSKCLLSYRFPADSINEIKMFFSNYLWIAQDGNS